MTMQEYLEQRKKTDLRFSDYERLFYDEFGNRINNYIIERFEKNSANKWVKVKEFSTHCGNTFVVNGKIYWASTGQGRNRTYETLIAVNMDPKSLTCGAYERIKGPDLTEYVKISGNEILFTTSIPSFYKLHRQDYSDGTYFYSLQDSSGDFRVEDGSHDLQKIIDGHQRMIDYMADESKKGPKSISAWNAEAIERERLIVDLLKAAKQQELNAGRG